MDAPKKYGCPKCGHKKFSGPPSAQTDDYLFCASCGHRLQLKELRQWLGDRAEREFEAILADAGVKFAKQTD